MQSFKGERLLKVNVFFSSGYRFSSPVSPVSQRRLFLKV
jgi:hypothetical protein